MGISTMAKKCPALEIVGQLGPATAQNTIQKWGFFMVARQISTSRDTMTALRLAAERLGAPNFGDRLCAALSACGVLAFPPAQQPRQVLC